MLLHCLTALNQVADLYERNREPFHVLFSLAYNSQYRLRSVYYFSRTIIVVHGIHVLNNVVI